MEKPSALPERHELTSTQRWLLDRLTDEFKGINGMCPPGRANSRGLTTIASSLFKRGLAEIRRGKHGWEVKRIVRCGIQYAIGTPAPKNAHYAVYYWSNVVYHVQKAAAERTLSALPYHQQEDARIERLR